MTSSLLHENPTYMTCFNMSTAFTPRQSLPGKLNGTLNSHSWTHSFRGIVTTPFLSESTGNLHTQTNTLNSHLTIYPEQRTSLFDREKSIISNPSDQEKEENHLTAVLQANGYPEKFISNTIKASQLPRQPANNNNTDNQEQITPVRVNLPYVKGTSEQLKRIFNDHNINCTFYTTTTFCTLLSHAKDHVPSEQRNNIVYKYDCKDCETVNGDQNEHLQRELNNTLDL